jgi:regulator of protease activity HflC (stomatin/prohibitin superfamily)
VFDHLIEFILDAIRALRFAVTIRSYQRAVILRLGKPHRDLAPGLHFFWPFYIEVPLSVNVVPETMLIGPQSLTSKDDVPLVISTVVTFSIEDVRKFLLDIEGAHQVIQDSALGVIAGFVMTHTWNEVRGVIPPDVEGKPIDADNEIAKATRRRAKKYGVHIVNLQISDLSRSRSYRLLSSSSAHHNIHGS